MPNDRNAALPVDETPRNASERDDDAAEIRYSLTALGEAALAADPAAGRGRRFAGFGPCIAVA